MPNFVIIHHWDLQTRLIGEIVDVVVVVVTDVTVVGACFGSAFSVDVQSVGCRHFVFCRVVASLFKYQCIGIK